MHVTKLAVALTNSALPNGSIFSKLTVAFTSMEMPQSTQVYCETVSLYQPTMCVVNLYILFQRNLTNVIGTNKEKHTKKYIVLGELQVI